MIFLIHGKNSDRNSFTLNAFLKAIPDEEYTFIELAREGCPWCEKQKIVIDDLVANHELKYLAMKKRC